MGYPSDVGLKNWGKGGRYDGSPADDLPARKPDPVMEIVCLNCFEVRSAHQPETLACPMGVEIGGQKQYASYMTYNTERRTGELPPEDTSSSLLNSLVGMEIAASVSTDMDTTSGSVSFDTSSPSTDTSSPFDGGGESGGGGATGDW